APPDRLRRNGEHSGPVVRPHNRVLLSGGPDKDAVVQPLRLDELILPLQVRSHDAKTDAPIRPVVFQNALRQQRTVGGAATDYAMDVDVAEIQTVARVRATSVRAKRTAQALLITVGVIEEIVVARRVGAERRVVALRRQDEWRAAPPPAHHLGGEQLLCFWIRGVGGGVRADRRHSLVQLAKDDIRPVLAQHLGLRDCRDLAKLILIAQDELPRLERPLLGVRAGDAAAFNCRMTDAVLEPEVLSVVRRGVAVLPPDHLDAAHFPIRRAGTLEQRLELRRARGQGDEAHMAVRRPSGFSHLSGAFSPTSPSSAARAAMPCWNSSGKLSSESCGTPSALRP